MSPKPGPGPTEAADCALPAAVVMIGASAQRGGIGVAEMAARLADRQGVDLSATIAEAGTEIDRPTLRPL